MAGLRDSDSDEYEFMTPQTMAERHRGNSKLQFASDKSKAGTRAVWSGHSESATLDRLEGSHKEDTASKKKKKFKPFGKGKSKEKDPKPLLKSSSFSAKRGSPVVISSPQISSLPPRSSQILVLDSPPKVGPKPPHRLSEEDERVLRAKQRHKEKMAAARESRLRRSSEPNPCRISLSGSESSRDFMIDRSYGEVEVMDLINQYADHLPLELVVSKGVYGMDDRYSLSTSDRCIVHFVKRRDLVRIQDPQSNKEFSVPINSAIKFAIIYNPNSNDSEARSGFTFTLVSDILERSPLPKMGLAHLSDPNIEGMKSTEVLVIKEVIFPHNPQDPRKLRVYSLTAKCQRDLPETQEVKMTTNPSFMQVYLPDIMKHVPNPHSLHISMYRNPLTRPLVAPGIPSSMFRRPLYLKKNFTDVLVIATGSSEGAEDSENQQPFEVPTDIDVEFQVIKHSADEKEQMIEQTRKLKEKLKEKDIRHHRYVGVTEEEHRMQMSLYRSLREGVGMEERIASEEAADGDYVKATSGNRLGLNHRVDLLEENLKRCCQLITESKVTIESLLQENAALTKKVSYLEERLAGHTVLEAQVESLSRQVDNVFNELDQLHVSRVPQKETKLKHVHSPLRDNEESPVPLKLLMEKQRWDKNKKLLSQMGLSEVLRMLELAGLSQYREIVLAEQVSGEVLIDCDDNMLERDLGIKSKIHRMKFMTVIEGRASEEMYKLVD